MSEEPLRRSERLKSQERSVSVDVQRSSSVETLSSDGNDSVSAKGTKRRQKRPASASTSRRRSNRITSLEPDDSPEEDAVASKTASRSPLSRGEKEWSVESNASGNSTASASKRRRRTTVVAMEPHVEVIKEEEEAAGAESSASRIAYHTRSRGPSREIDQSVLTPKRRTSRRISETKAKISSLEADDCHRTETVHIVVDGVGQESSSIVDDVTNATKNSLDEEAIGQEKTIIVQEITDDQSDLRGDLCSGHDGIAHMEKEPSPQKVASSAMSSPCDKKMDECTGLEEGQEAVIVVPFLTEEELMATLNIESPSSQAVNRIEQNSNEERMNDPNEECTKRSNEIEPQDGDHVKEDDSITSGHQEMDNRNEHVPVDETHADETVIEEATKESSAIADAGVPSSPCNTSLKVQSPAECLPSKLNIVINDDKLDMPKEGSFGVVEIQVEQSLVLNESSADTKEMETAEDHLLQVEKEEIEGVQPADRTKKQEIEADGGGKGTELEANERAKEPEFEAHKGAEKQKHEADETGKEPELDAEEEAKKHEFNTKNGTENQEREADDKGEEQQDECCSSEKSAEKGSTFGAETTGFKEELTTMKEKERPTEDSGGTEASIILKKKKGKKSKHLSELKASPIAKEESKKTKKLDKHSDHMFGDDSEPLVSGTTEEKAREALIEEIAFTLEDTSSSDYDVVASKQNKLDVKEAGCESVSIDMAREKQTLKKKKKAKLVDEKTDHLVESYGAENGGEMEQNVGGGEDGVGFWPLIDNVTSLWANRNNGELLINDLKAAYSFVANFGESDVNLPNELVVENLETIWQQIAARNKKVSKRFKKYATLLEIPVPTGKVKKRNKEDVKEIRFEEAAASEQDEVLEVEDEEADTDLFNLKEEDLEDLERELDEMKDEEDKDIEGGDEKDEISRKEPKKYRKTVVDDQFFSLAEMEDYLNSEERKDTSKGFFDDIEDGDNTDDFPIDYHYSDFFGGVEGETSSALVEKKKKRKSEKLTATSKADKCEEGGKRKKKKKVRFDVDEENDGEEILVNERFGNRDIEERPVLLGAVEHERNEETEFEKRQKKVRSKIAAIEEANLAPRNWEMGGEVSSFERDENTLLERHIAFEHSAKSAPIITVDSTTKLEALIIQRIKDKAFDDVERKVREPEASSSYRAPVEEPIVKKSLAEVYEEQFQKTQEGETRDVKVDEKIAEIEVLMNELFKKLDALSHFRYIPPEIRPEVRIVSNVASLQKEEVGPMASTDDVLMAPEEIKKHEKGAIKSKEERDETDRARERRKKKKMQRIKTLSKRHREEQNDANSALNEEPKKKKKKRQVDRSGVDGAGRSATENIKSTSFFKQLHQTVTNELKEKTNKTAKNKKQRLAKHNAGAKYVL